MIIISECPSCSAQEVSFPVYHDYNFPGSIDICGEKMPLENQNVWEMMDREFNIEVWDRAQVFLWLKRAGKYFPYVEEKLNELGMPDDLKYVMVAESAFLNHARSLKGAVGPWQFMTGTARLQGLRKNRMIDERRSLNLSTDAALKYLKGLNEKFGNWTLAIAAYNCGFGRLEKEIKEQKIKNFYRLNLPLETERYIFRIAAAKVIIENPEKYGYKISPKNVYPKAKYATIDINIRIPLHINDVAHEIGTDFKILKELNHQFIDYYFTKGKHNLKVPPESVNKVPGVIKRLTIAAYKESKKKSNFYVIRQGDNLSKISRKTGVSVAKIKRLNGINGSLILAGQRLRIGP
ncbi:MAG: transglycosylase SLT domain-containing protein [Desulfobacterales bacterium]|nr:transglycosylase SLT domain-containing protein [Desulfobacteraceae bacterium]MBT7085437.1 transglycosylase SLT domain-containing protein [Desulfobacterales bacterium]MBT7697196.1 transglycosylase SLT domain-containing protein [Desulfobacterales bacterium]